MTTQLEPLAEVDAAISSACNEFVEQARLALPLDRVAVVLLNTEGDTSRVVFSWGIPGQAANPAAGYGLGPSERSQNPPAVALNIPLYDGDGQMGEVLCQGNSVTPYSPDERELVHHLTEQLALRLENAGLSQRLQAREEEISAVDEIAQIITSTTDIDQVYAEFAAKLKKLVDFDRSGIKVIDPAARTILTKYSAGPKESGRSAGETGYANDGQVQHILTTRQTLIRSDLGRDSRFPSDPAHLAAGLRSSIGLPLISNGKVIGTLTLRSRRTGAYGAREQAFLERLANQIAPAVKNAQLYQNIQANLSKAKDRSQRRGPDGQTQADLAHLLKTPLTSIKGYTSSLLRAALTWPPEVQRQFLQTIEQETDRLDQAVRDLLAPVDFTIEEG